MGGGEADVTEEGHRDVMTLKDVREHTTEERGWRRSVFEMSGKD